MDMNWRDKNLDISLGKKDAITETSPRITGIACIDESYSTYTNYVLQVKTETLELKRWCLKSGGYFDKPVRSGGMATIMWILANICAIAQGWTTTQTHSKVGDAIQQAAFLRCFADINIVITKKYQLRWPLMCLQHLWKMRIQFEHANIEYNLSLIWSKRGHRWKNALFCVW